MTVKQLRALRMNLRKSQYVVAGIAEMSRNRLSLIECGYVTPTTDEIYKIKLVLNQIEKTQNTVKKLEGKLKFKGSEK